MHKIKPQIITPDQIDELEANAIARLWATPENTWGYTGEQLKVCNQTMLIFVKSLTDTIRECAAVTRAKMESTEHMWFYDQYAYTYAQCSHQIENHMQFWNPTRELELMALREQSLVG